MSSLEPIVKTVKTDLSAGSASAFIASPKTSQPIKAASQMAPYPDIHSLTKGIRRGEEAAFSQFHDLYSFRIYKRLLLLTQGNEDSAREICQRVIIKLARRFEVFQEETALWSWLCRVIKNEFIDHLRSNKRRSTDLPLEAIPSELLESGKTDSALIEPLHRALEELAPIDRELLQSFYVDEQSTQHLASEMGTTPKAIESRLARLRHKVKASLLKYLHNENQPGIT